MVTRAISGVIFIIIVIGALYLGFIPTLLLFTAIAFIGAREFYLLASKNAQPYILFGAFSTALLVLVKGMYIYSPETKFLIAIPLINAFTGVIYVLKSKSESTLVDLSVTLAGAMYLAIPLLSLLFLGVFESKDPNNFNWLLPLSIFVLTWTNDTGAYISGRTFGKTKLFERISPNKTWEGTIGGMILAMGMGLLIHHYFQTFSMPIWVGAAIVVSISANLGDLMESAFKRNANVKDSGNIMPGHGGVLDRFDAILLAAPMILAYLLLVTSF